LVEDLVSDPIARNVNSERKVPMAVSKRSIFYLQGRAFDNLSDGVQTEQNTKVF
jgi:hypothetical protein